MGCIKFEPGRHYGTFDVGRACSKEDAFKIVQSRGSGLHVSGALKVAAVGVGAALTGGIASGVVTLAAAAARKQDPPPPPPELATTSPSSIVPEDASQMIPQTLSSLGGSSGRSATPIIPTKAAGVVPGLIGVGLDWLRSRTNQGNSGTALVPCPQGTHRVGQSCLDLMPGGTVSGGGMLLTTGEVVRGRYGAGEMPAMTNITTHRCRKGLVLGDDGVCYRRGDLRKDERKWVPARKPLLTGGELNAIRTAARAANKMKSHQRSLQSLGLLPRPKSRRQIELELRYGGKLRGR